MAGTEDTTQNQNTAQNGAEVPLVDQVKDQVKQQTQQAVQHCQEYAGQAVNIVSIRLKSSLAQQKDHLATGITDVAQILKKNGDSFRSQGIGVFAGPYIDQAVTKLSEVGTTIQNKDIDEVIRDTENFARLQPAAFVGVATLLGFVAARFLRSSGQTVSDA
jgi:ElaB/YqjD/DUF883 family membrane-anchored ribosome-binding protein